MLGDVQDVLVKKLLDHYYDGDGSIGASPAKINLDVMKTYGVEVTVTQDAVTYKICLSFCMLVVSKIYPFISILNHIASTRILLRLIINQPLKPFNIIWRYCKSLLKMFTKMEWHTSLWICKHHYNALGTPVMTVCDEKSTCLPMRLPCR